MDMSQHVGTSAKLMSAPYPLLKRFITTENMESRGAISGSIAGKEGAADRKSRESSLTVS